VPFNSIDHHLGEIKHASAECRDASNTTVLSVRSRRPVAVAERFFDFMAMGGIFDCGMQRNVWTVGL